MKKILKKIYSGEYLSEIESYTLFHNIFYKKLNDIQIAAVLAILSARSETYEEILGARKLVIQHIKNFPKPSYCVVDIVGTGGDQKNSFNISTVSAIVAACYGIKIAKMCNVGSFHNLGSANLLKKLNFNLEIPVKQAIYSLDKYNVCFLLANFYLDHFKNVSKVRSLLKTKTIFNILGPLLNPIQPKHALIGVYKIELMLIYAKILATLKYKRAIIVHSGGMDEATLHANTHVVELNNNNVTEYILSPEDFGLQKCPKKYILNKTSEENYLETIKLFQGSGEKTYVRTIAINVSLLMKVLGSENLRENTLNILEFIKTGKIYDFVLQLSRLYQ
ncbi:anthranilate phosphoribosyltransferase [Buchnera aphidicola]|uniref:anthranilate phosphoribosyltransferase n=1 Tax=Buchnera aphidicola TaxID=9 RepID=UPI00094D51C4|nr:anthranilate phosphoribosyltransferase [Buchnera aphidicola]